MRRPTAILASVILVAACAGGSTPSPSPTQGPTATPGPTASPTVAPTATTPPAGSLEPARSALARVVADPSEAEAAAEAMNAFGLDLYGRLSGGTGNIMVSPASVAIALSMARAGARGATADEMDAVLRGLGSDELAAAANALDAALAARTGTYQDANGEDQEVVLRVANALFAQDGMPLEAGFLDAMATRYDAGAWLVDYKADPEAARQAINAWVADHTEDRIPEILAPGQVTEAWRLALANAIYLKAAWLYPFPEELTQPAPFHLVGGSGVEVPTMAGMVQAGYAKGPGWTAVDLSYVGRELSMLVIVPDDLAAFEAAFDPAVLEAIVGSLDSTKVHLWLPRFDVESRIELSDVLAGLGMPTPFSDAADFGGITTAEPLRIGTVIHQANMTVDEKGTEAAAATVVGFDTSGGGEEPPELRVDRPFLVVLRDVTTGAIVFLGRVVDPSIAR